MDFDPSRYPQMTHWGIKIRKDTMEAVRAKEIVTGTKLTNVVRMAILAWLAEPMPPHDRQTLRDHLDHLDDLDRQDPSRG